MGVIGGGVLILIYQWYWVDALITFLIAGLVLWQGLKMLPKTIHLLMEGTPEDISFDEIKESMESISGVSNVHHIHVWNLDEIRIALEAHVVVISENLSDVEKIKDQLKDILNSKFNISHSTLEFEHSIDASCEEND